MSNQSSFSGFGNYKQMVIELTNDLKQLKGFSERMKLEGNTEAISTVLQRLTEDKFSVAIIGEFNRGKSTLINALMGKDVLPMDVIPTTATLNKVTYDISPYIVVEYKNGKTEKIEIDQLSEYVTKLTKKNEEKAATIKEVTVYYPVNYCRNGVTIVDTPGLNDDAAMAEVTMSVLPQVDAALMVVMAQVPFSESERSFLESKVITSDLGRVLFVVTGIDLLDEDDVDKVLTHIKNQIQEHIIKKAENTFGSNSREYEEYKRKIGKVRVYGISAKKALKAKLKGDDNMLAQSCFPEFEAALERFLTEDRGAVMLNAPISRIKTASIEIVKAISLRESALAMQKEEFNQKYTEAMHEIEKIREERQVEFNRINEASQKTYDELLPSIRNFWPGLEKAAYAVVDDFPLTMEELKSHTDDTQERLQKAVGTAISRAGQEQSERIQEAINRALGNEAERLSEFESHFFEATENIQGLFTYNEKNGSEISGNALVSIATGLFSIIGLGGVGGLMGLGGIVEGYKEAGWKGALLGGGTSAVSFIATTTTVNLLLGALAIPLAWPAAVIGTIGIALFTTFLGKKAVKSVFGGGDDQKILKVKEDFKDNIKKELDKMRAEEDFSEKVRSQVDTAFTALKDKIKTETDHILNDTHSQLTELKVALAQGELSGEKEKADLKDMLVAIDAMCGRADVIGKQLTAILSRGV